MVYLSKRKEECLTRKQEKFRKDVERTFGVLQSKWHIVAKPALFWSKETMKEAMKCFIIPHKSMVDERSGLSAHEVSNDSNLKISNGCPTMWRARERETGNTLLPQGSIESLCEVHTYLKDRCGDFTTRRLVKEHLWSLEGDA